MVFRSQLQFMCQAVSAISDGFTGSCLLSVVEIWHLEHRVISPSTKLLHVRHGNQCFALRICLVSVIPKWPLLCIAVITCFYSFFWYNKMPAT